MDWRVDNYVLDFLTKETKLKGEVCLLNRKFYLLWWLFIKSKRFLYVSMMCFLIGVKNLVFLLAILSLYAETNLWKGCLVKAAVTSIFEASSTLFAFPEKKLILDIEYNIKVEGIFMFDRIHENQPKH